MRIEATTLDPERQRLIREEFAAAEAIANKRNKRDRYVYEQKRTCPVYQASGRAVVVNLAAPGARELIPPHVLLQLKIGPAAGEARPGAFAAFCDWERRCQSYQIVPDDTTAWVLGGGAEGALYGAYALITALTGVRWYGCEDEDAVPAEPVEDFAGAFIPDVALRGFEGSLGKWDIAFIRRLMQWMARNRLNLILFNASQWTQSPDRREIADLARLFGVRLALGGHAPQLFLPEHLFDKYPEYFGLRDGKRSLRATVEIPDVPGRYLTSPIQPCYTNPDALAHLADAIAAFIDNTPELDVFSLWPHDGINNWCQCESCLAKTPFEMLYNLALAIAARTRREVPIEVLCYTNTLDVPRQPLPPSDCIYVLFCPYLRRYEHRFYDAGFDAADLTLGSSYPDPEPVNPKDDREYGILLDRWLPHMKACGAGLGIFAYYQLVFHDETGRSDRSRYLYHPDPHLVQDELRRYKQHGMSVFYDCSWPIPGFWPDSRFYAYLPALLWSHASDAADLIDTYYRAALGPDAAPVQQALQAIAQALTSPHRAARLPATLSEAASVFDRLAGPRGDRYRLWLQYVRLAVQSRAHFDADDSAGIVAAERSVIDFLATHHDALNDHISVAWMKRYSEAVIRAAEQGEARGALPTG